MSLPRPKFVRVAGPVVLAALMLLFGYLIAAAGYQALGKWPSISAAFAACVVLWVVAGPAMLIAGLWILGCRGRNQIPLWIGGVAALVSGGSLVVGVLTYVIPCSGPS
ncbi:MAG TPA: hypothetical protein VFL57_01175 [Bryobacteraceae bacterium]|nr:hypothetical protein [Bryobacteraceae bacterium]